MTEKEYTTYDFRQSGAGDDSADAFQTWVAKASQAFAEQWASLSGSEASLVSNDFCTHSFKAATDEIPVTNLYCTFNIPDENSMSIWHMTQSDASKVVAELLSMPVPASERELTEIESGLARMFFEQFAQSIEQGWLGKQALNCSVQTVSINPKRVRFCRPQDLVISCKVLIQLPEDEITIVWISKKQEMADLLELVADRRASVGSTGNPQRVVELLPIEIVGLLGQATIPMRHLANIAVGDIVHLNQRIDRPVVASIDGRPFFECWPGKVGDNVGLEISSVLNPSTS